MNLISRYLNRISGGAYRQNKEFILTFLERNEEARVLDIGCGEGDLSLEVMNTVGGMLYGVEVLEKYALRAHTNGINVVMANVDKGLPFRDESFDVLVSNQVLEHVSDTDNFIRECYRVLRYGGACVLSTPNLASIHNIVALILGYQPFATAVSDEFICGNPLDPWNNRKFDSYPRHKRVFTATSLKKLFEFHGFKIEAFKGSGLHPLPLSISKYFKWPRYSLFLIIKAKKI
jgi:methionine biosynthesis protein MetW